jgi:glycosyltransferase A (GT-A) superfamily protein (DUF2064 family)
VKVNGSSGGEKRPVLAVYFRHPDARRVKTRLAVGVGDRAARRFYGGCLKSLRHDLQILGRRFDIAICPAREADEDWEIEFFPEHDHVVPQAFGSLGTRIEHTDLVLRDRGYERVVIIGSDAPSLPIEYVEAADPCLAHADVALGPCRDGGVYAIGSRVPLPALKAIPWGTEQVFGRLRDRLEGEGFVVAELPVWYDVDRVEDLVRVHGDLLQSFAPYRQDLAELIAEILSSCPSGGANLPPGVGEEIPPRDKNGGDR